MAIKVRHLCFKHNVRVCPLHIQASPKPFVDCFTARSRGGSYTLVRLNSIETLRGLPYWAGLSPTPLHIEIKRGHMHNETISERQHPHGMQGSCCISHVFANLGAAAISMKTRLCSSCWLKLRESPIAWWSGWLCNQQKLGAAMAT